MGLLVGNVTLLALDVDLLVKWNIYLIGKLNCAYLSRILQNKYIDYVKSSRLIFKLDKNLNSS